MVERKRRRFHRETNSSQMVGIAPMSGMGPLTMIQLRMDTLEPRQQLPIHPMAMASTTRPAMCGSGLLTDSLGCIPQGRSAIPAGRLMAGNLWLREHLICAIPPVAHDTGSPPVKPLALKPQREISVLESRPIKHAELPLLGRIASSRYRLGPKGITMQMRNLLRCTCLMCQR